jgi:hypothetical protein
MISAKDRLSKPLKNMDTVSRARFQGAEISADCRKSVESLFRIRKFSLHLLTVIARLCHHWHDTSPENRNSEGASGFQAAQLSMNEPKPPSPRKPYIKPIVNVLTRLQAALLLLGRAWDGDKNAQELLEKGADILFPSPHKSE